MLEPFKWLFLLSMQVNTPFITLYTPVAITWKQSVSLNVQNSLLYHKSDRSVVINNKALLNFQNRLL